MEERARKKRPGGAGTQRKERRDSVKNPARGGSSSGIARKNTPVTEPHSGSRAYVQGLELNAETVRQAVILSEIIGKPLAKRGRRR